jgi:hypothetical protein
MTIWIQRSLIAVLLSSLAPAVSFAQSTDVGITGLGLISLQPIDDSYVGGPYLSEGIGGAAPGFGVALNAVMPSGFVVLGELTTARFEQEQSGRLVPGSDGGSHSVVTELHDTIVSALIGQAVAAGRTRFQFVAGVGMVVDSPMVGDIDLYEHGGEDPSRFVLTGGIDMLHPVASRAGVALTARYSHIGRIEQAQYLGIGPHIFRLGAGIRVKLN